MTKLPFDISQVTCCAFARPNNSYVSNNIRHHSPFSYLQIYQHGKNPLIAIDANTAQVLGRVIHIGVDVILVSAVLAGIKRSTGLQ
jgi:Fungal protein of unknown function (DUF1748)